MSEEIEIAGAFVAGEVDRDRQEARMAAAYIGQYLEKIAEPDPRIRQDMGNIQVDFGYIHKGATKHYPIAKLSFTAANERGVELVVRLDEFKPDPAAYARDLLEHLGPMLRNTLRLRARKKLANTMIHQGLTGVAHG
nr:hypothetical protein [uncultured Halomonas sp.]